MISDQDLKDILTNPKKAGNNNSHYTARCPYCNKNDHFYINRTTGLWDCKKCGEEGNIYKLLYTLGKTFLLPDFKSVERGRIKMLGEYAQEDDDDIEMTPEVRNLPKGFKRIHECEYLSSRGFDDSIFDKYIIGRTKRHRKLRNHVIIAIEENDNVVGYLARLAWTKEKLERVKRKGGDLST